MGWSFALGYLLIERMYLAFEIEGDVVVPRAFDIGSDWSRLVIVLSAVESVDSGNIS